MPSIVIIHYYFDKKRSVASALSTSGMGLAMFVISPLVRLSLDFYGWRGTILLASAAALNGVPIGMLYRPLPRKYLFARQKQKVLDGKNTVRTSTGRCAVLKNLIDFSLLKNTRFLLYVIGTCLANSSLNVQFVHMVNKSVAMGISKVEASFIPAIQGIGITVSRPLFGLIGDIPCVNRSLQYATGVFLCGTVAILAGMANTFPITVVVTVLFSVSACKSEYTITFSFQQFPILCFSFSF